MCVLKGMRMGITKRILATKMSMKKAEKAVCQIMGLRYSNPIRVEIKPKKKSVKRCEYYIRLAKEAIEEKRSMLS